jgi:uncharacterized protein YhdP
MTEDGTGPSSPVMTLRDSLKKEPLATNMSRTVKLTNLHGPAEEHSHLDTPLHRHGNSAAVWD